MSTWLDTMEKIATNDSEKKGASSVEISEDFINKVADGVVKKLTTSTPEPHPESEPESESEPEPVSEPEPEQPN